MKREIKRDYKQYLMIITFTEGSDVCEYFKMVGNAERWHEVSQDLLAEWAEGFDYQAGTDLFDFLESTISTENCNDLVQFIEAKTPVKSTWVSGF